MEPYPNYYLLILKTSSYKTKVVLQHKMVRTDNLETKNERFEKQSKWSLNGEIFKKNTDRIIKLKGYKKSLMNWTFRKKFWITISKNFELQNSSASILTVISIKKWAFSVNSSKMKRNLKKKRIKTSKSFVISSLNIDSKKTQAHNNQHKINKMIHL